MVLACFSAVSREEVYKIKLMDGAQLGSYRLPISPEIGALSYICLESRLPSPSAEESLLVQIKVSLLALMW